MEGEGQRNVGSALIHYSTLSHAGRVGGRVAGVGKLGSGGGQPVAVAVRWTGRFEDTRGRLSPQVETTTSAVRVLREKVGWQQCRETCEVGEDFTTDSWVTVCLGAAAGVGKLLLWKSGGKKRFNFARLS